MTQIIFIALSVLVLAFALLMLLWRREAFRLRAKVEYLEALKFDELSTELEKNMDRVMFQMGFRKRESEWPSEIEEK